MQRGTRRPPFHPLTPRRSLITALVFLIAVPVVALDLAKSAREYQALRAWSVCSLHPESVCLTAEPVTFGGGSSRRRSALQQWYATDADGESTYFDLQPGYGEYTETLPGPGTLYRAQDEVVAFSKKESDEYVPTAFAGSHAIAVDLAVLVLLIGVIALEVRRVRWGRRARLSWSEEFPLHAVSRSGSINALIGAGLSGAVVTFMAGLSGAAAWVPALLIGATAGLYPTAIRRIRSRQGRGKRAAY